MNDIKADKQIAVIYKSVYGTTKRYAEWIAQALDADLIERKNASAKTLGQYSVIVYGGGLYAGGILGVDLVAKNPCRKLILFTVGLADPDATDYAPIINRSFPNGLPSGAKVFHLRGGIDYGKLGLIHKGAMAMMKKMTIGKKRDEELTSEERIFAETYGGKIDFTDRNTITPIVAYVRAIIC